MYRTNAQSRAVEDAFVRAGLPYRLVGATRFYARKEIKDVLAFLRIVNNPADTVSLQRVVNVPPRGIGEKTFAQLEGAARANNMTCLDVINTGNLEGRAAKALKEFGTLWAQWVRLRGELSVGQIFDHVIQTSGYRDYLRDGTEEGEDRWANVVELRNVAADFGDAPLSDFLNDISLVSEVDNYDENANAPTLMTLHAAKGLEFRVVFIVGLVEGVLPHSRSLDDPEEMAEERRLMYVGITRAKDRLYLLRPFRRSQWGMSDMAEPSRFLADLPDDAVDGKPKKNSEVVKDITSWSGGKTQNVKRETSAGMRFKPGDKVTHPKFGEGLVLRSTKVRDDEEVEVFFGGVGGKRLSAEMSGLKKLVK
jgi:DNA helicase-2/ATP-dependent DNA helicase PcrA